MKSIEDFKSAIQKAAAEYAEEFKDYNFDIIIEIESTDGWVERPDVLQENHY